MLIKLGYVFCEYSHLYYVLQKKKKGELISDLGPNNTPQPRKDNDSICIDLSYTLVFPELLDHSSIFSCALPKKALKAIRVTINKKTFPIHLPQRRGTERQASYIIRDAQPIPCTYVFYQD
jgi:hypothetical protein